MFWNTNVSKLFDQDKFYDAFAKDISHARRRVIIESPFITTRRLAQLTPAFEKLVRRGVRVIINTKPFDEHDASLREMANEGVLKLQAMGVQVLMTVGHHRKLAIIDDAIPWEGSLNILSQNDSCEIMRRIQSEAVVEQITSFLRLDKFYRVE